MDFYNRLKSLLGIPKRNEDGFNLPDRNSAKTDIHKNTRDPQDPHEWSSDEYERFGFNIFSSPLEMHRYFEHQMNEVMKSFGMFHGDESFLGKSGETFGKFEEPMFGDYSFNYDSSHFPKIEDFQGSDGSQSGSLRDQYLKPGYEEAKPNEPNKGDADLDGRFDMGDLDIVLKGKASRPHTFSFGQSMTTKTIRNADGSVETHRTLTDQHGNQQVTITHSRGDQKYTRTIKTDKNGHQEVTENLVNIDENDKDAFLRGSWPQNSLTDKGGKLPPNWFPFDKFFK